MNNKDLATFVPRLECFHGDGLIRGRHIDGSWMPTARFTERVRNPHGPVGMPSDAARAGPRVTDVDSIRGQSASTRSSSVLESQAWIVATPSRVIGVGFNGRAIGMQIAYAIASSRLSDAGPAVRPHLEAARKGDWSTDEDGRVAWFVDPDAPAEGA